MAELKNWQISVSDLGYVGLVGYVQCHPRYEDGTKISYKTKLEDLKIQEDRLVFETKTVSYDVLFSDYDGVHDTQFLGGSPVADIYKELSRVNADMSAELYRIYPAKR